MYVEIIGIIIILMALRAIITKNRSERLLYLNVIGFGVSAIIALVINTPFGFVVAAVYFVCSTIGSNAIAYSLDELEEEILLEDWGIIMEFISLISIALMLIGTVGIILLKKPLDKVIMFSILDAGFLLAVVQFGYLDVAMFIALLAPLSILIYILSIVKIKQTRARNLQGDNNG